MACIVLNKTICCAAVAKSDKGDVASKAWRASAASRQFMASKVKDGCEEKRGRAE